jgi:hypothetical protein
VKVGARLKGPVQFFFVKSTGRYGVGCKVPLYMRLVWEAAYYPWLVIFSKDVMLVPWRNSKNTYKRTNAELHSSAKFRRLLLFVHHLQPASPHLCSFDPLTTPSREWNKTERNHYEFYLSPSYPYKENSLTSYPLSSPPQIAHTHTLKLPTPANKNEEQNSFYNCRITLITLRTWSKSYQCRFPLSISEYFCIESSDLQPLMHVSLSCTCIFTHVTALTKQ